MTVTLELKPDLDGRLQELARTSGLSLEAFLSKLIEERIHSVRNLDALALLTAWEKEDRTDDPAEIEEREIGWNAFKKTMNEDHSSSRVLFP